MRLRLQRLLLLPPTAATASPGASQATFQHFLPESLVKMATSVTPVFSNMNLEQDEEDALLNSPPNVLQVRQMYA